MRMEIYSHIFNPSFLFILLKASLSVNLLVWDSVRSPCRYISIGVPSRIHFINTTNFIASSCNWRIYVYREWMNKLEKEVIHLWESDTTKPRWNNSPVIYYFNRPPGRWWWLVAAGAPDNFIKALRRWQERASITRTTIFYVLHGIKTSAMSFPHKIYRMFVSTINRRLCVWNEKPQRWGRNAMLRWVAKWCHTQTTRTPFECDEFVF